MSQSEIRNCRVAGISSCSPSKIYNNREDSTQFAKIDVEKVVSLAGIVERHICDDSTCSSDLCYKSAEDIIEKLGWDKDTIDGLIFITQSPDYFLPSTSCVLHERLGLPDNCAAFDIGLGCSGYPYGIWMAAMMLNSSHKRILVLHGETPSHFTSPDDKVTFLLFGDAGSATALEYDENKNAPWHFTFGTDGKGFEDLIIYSGGFRKRFDENKRQHYLYMKGTNLFNFTIKKIPSLIQDTLNISDKKIEDIDYFIFHQSNKYMMKHLLKKCGIKEAQAPIILDRFGNTGGPSVPLTITQTLNNKLIDKPVSLMLLGYGVGLSWSAALLELDKHAIISHVVYD